jgi:hypothetical protein
MTSWSPAGIAARVRWLIESKDKGRLEAAARRLGVKPSDLDQIERLLASDGGSRGTRLLAAVVQTYHVDACWLLTGEYDMDAAALAPEARLRLAEMLLSVADALLADRARSRTPQQPHEALGPRSTRTA